VLIGSPSFRDEVVGHHGTDPELFRLIPGATDTGRFTPSGRTILQDPPVLLFHGRVDRRKGVLDLLEALPDGVRLVVSGIGPDLDAAKEQADDRTTFLGYVAPDDAPEVYRSADVFVSPTYSEGFSNTVLEAMASGLPVVSTSSVGVVDCIRHDENGLLHEPGDVDGLRELLERVLADAALRERLSATALEEVRRLYSWPVLARSISDVYEELAGTAPDVSWSLPDEVDLSCRFRSAAHLL
jgi:glycosyltransferase involved in cell wall biosynthesis